MDHFQLINILAGGVQLQKVNSCVEFLAHKDGERIQTVQEHSYNTANLAKKYAVQPWGNYCYAMGLIHDIGKYQSDFQKRISGDLSIRIPHAVCGAQTALHLFGKNGAARIAQYVISGHHSGLQDFGNIYDGADKPTLCGTLIRETEDYSRYLEEIKIDAFDMKALNSFFKCNCTEDEVMEAFAFITRYCFSCLTDADWIDTEQFYTQKSRTALTSSFAECLNEIDKKFQSFVSVTPLQKARSTIQAQVYKNVDTQANIFLMNMPTGSGKTLCSMKFALERAIKQGKKRIIYVIPYNSIIEQTAQVFDDIFGKHAQILRHQSSYLFEEDDRNTEEDLLKLKQATENWDADIILTTAVQFFQSLYSNQRSKLRKLHNLANSIIIFDEAHLMPLDYLAPCLRGIAHITKFLSSDAVFLTATMPDYHKLLKEFGNSGLEICDLIQDKSTFHLFEKCAFEFIGTKTNEEIMRRAMQQPSSLIVVNKRKSAIQLFQQLGDCDKYHLSTYMTAIHRKKVINQIRNKIAQLETEFPNLENVPQNRRIVVVSTSLIEAGVDLDFFTVYRELWGLDSILQAGGRCNREGKRQGAKLYIFERQDENKKKIDLCQSITKGILEEYETISSTQSIATYYQRYLYMRKEDLMKNSLGQDGGRATEIEFKSYAERFKLIDQNTVSVAVANDDASKALLENARSTGFINTRKVQPYCCTVYQWEFEDLYKQGVLEDFDSGVYWLANLSYYDNATGIKVEGSDLIY